MKFYQRLEKYVIFACVLLGIGCAMMWRQLAQPRMVVASSFDFGTVEGGKDVTHIFEIANSGRVPLVLGRISVSCGCIKEALLLDSQKVLPGQTARLKAVMELPTYAMKKVESIEVDSNDPLHPSISLILRVTVKPLLGLSPPILNFGILEKTDLPQSQVLLMNLPASGVTEPLIQTDDPQPWLQIEKSRMTGKSWSVNITLSRDAPIGVISSGINVVTPNSTEVVPILGQIVGEVYAEPSELAFSRRQLPMAREMVASLRSHSIAVRRIRLVHVSNVLKNKVKFSLIGNTIAAKTIIGARPRKQAGVLIERRFLGNVVISVEMYDATKKLVTIPVSYRE